MRPPNDIRVLVIGGGPAGSYCAAALAREGIQVALYESAKFPRYHVGESLVPSIRHYLRFIDCEAKLADHGFKRKPGASMKFNQHKREGYTDFIALGHDNNAWNVVRSEFDQLLLQHAQSSGVLVYEQTKVTSISFSKDDPTKPISAFWTQTLEDSSQTTGTTSFSYLIDASGRRGILSTRYLKNRHYNSSLKNIAVWSYWKNVGVYGVGTSREGSPWFEALTDESGWCWFIPLHDGTTSVGIVMNQEMYNAKYKDSTLLSQSPFSNSSAPNPSNSTTVSAYLASLALAPGVVKLISPLGQMLEETKSASDYSYSAPVYAGPSFRIIGDAGAFIDPFFSSGIHLALTSGLSAAASVCASIRGDCSETDAYSFHTKRVAISYTRFQVVVLSAYKQMRAQNTDVLCDLDENNFDRAFAYLRPIIQGAADMGCQLSENEIQKSLDFCLKLFNPTSPEQHVDIVQDAAVAKQLLDVNGPLVCPEELDVQLTDPKNNEKRMVLEKINARRVVHAEYQINNLEAEPLEGLSVRLVHGSLGLRKLEA
ncbi:hypothetical protein C8J56DRAFT_443917 [Mycena floridula]|nr:hypothetical protein C8J56DRAFT_443917 [Mycena floridula]